MWIGNYLPAAFSRTQYSIYEAHCAPTFYLKIACAIGFTFLFDYAADCYKTLIVEDPTEYLRQLVSQDKSTEDPANLDHFNRLVERDA